MGKLRESRQVTGRLVTAPSSGRAPAAAARGYNSAAGGTHRGPDPAAAAVREREERVELRLQPVRDHAAKGGAGEGLH